MIFMVFSVIIVIKFELYFTTQTIVSISFYKKKTKIIIIYSP